jgi:formylglycine-generating enzyme required for sulfatase activity
MRTELQRRLILLALAYLSTVSFPGCTRSSTGDPVSASSDDAGRTSNEASEGDRVAGTNGDVLTKPASFETIPLGKDESYEAIPTPLGSAAGEIRELTALKIKFCWCPIGTFNMGSPADALGSERNEQQFEVHLSKGFWMQQTELTQSQYEALMGVNPSHFRSDSNPVESVTFQEAKEFCRRLCELPPEKNSGNLYRLPTEAEWEYACRAGSTSSFCFGDDEMMLEAYGWFNGNAARTTHPVGGKKPNAWGLHDMHGNVGEWCSDYYGPYPSGPQTDPTGPETGGQIVVRGGGWFFVPQNSRSAHRDAYPPGARYVGLGFRLVAEPSKRNSTPP